MNPKQLHDHWRAELKDRIATTRELLHKRHSLSAKEVHDLRVALRRARLLVNVGRHFLDKSKAKSFRGRTRTLLDLVSPIRDCDVALGWLNKTSSSAKVVTKLRSRRERLWHATKHQIRSDRSKVTIRFRSRHHARKLEQRLEKKMTDAAQRCQVIIKNDKKLPATKLHALRRIVRRWRYLHELLLKSRKQNRDVRLPIFLKVQDCLGALQNTEAILKQLKSLGRPKELGQIRSKLKRGYVHQHRDAIHQIKSLPLTA